MLLFLLAFEFVYAAAFTALVIDERDGVLDLSAASFMGLDARWTLAGFVLSILLAPLFAALVFVPALNHWHPRALFDGRQKRPIARLFTGAITALLGLILSIVGLLLARFLDDWHITTAGAVVACGTVLQFLPKLVPFRCPGCGYDLRASLSPACLKCPECGTPYSAPG